MTPLRPLFQAAHSTAAAPLPALVQPAPSWATNPRSDLDLTTTTDAEDLAVFAADLVEFAEQDHALLLDSLMEVGLSSLLLGAAGRVLSRAALPLAQAQRR